MTRPIPLLALLAVAAQAQEVDATKPLRCALAEAAECDEMAECSDVTPEQIELPGEWRIDFAAKQLVSADGQRTSPIQAVEAFEAVVVLQGHQNGRGWTMVPSIDRVYVNERARSELGWRPRYDFKFVVDRLVAGQDFRSPLARLIGSKGYHAESFAEGPYPVE